MTKLLDAKIVLLILTSSLSLLYGCKNAESASLMDTAQRSQFSVKVESILTAPSSMLSHENGIGISAAWVDLSSTESHALVSPIVLQQLLFDLRYYDKIGMLWRIVSDVKSIRISDELIKPSISVDRGVPVRVRISFIPKTFLRPEHKGTRFVPDTWSCKLPQSQSQWVPADIGTIAVVNSPDGADATSACLTHRQHFIIKDGIFNIIGD